MILMNIFNKLIQLHNLKINYIQKKKKNVSINFQMFVK